MLDLIPLDNQNREMTRKLKRIAPLQLGKMLGILYGLMGLIFLPFFALFAVIGSLAGSQSQESAGVGALAAGGMLFMGLMMPVIYGVMGFVLGVISAALYNLVARWIGGIEVEVE